MSILVRELGASVRRLREQHGWSQEQLAEYAGLNRSYVGEIERGSSIASIVTVDKLARAFQVPIERLLNPSSGGSDSTVLPDSALIDPPSVI